MQAIDLEPCELDECLSGAPPRSRLQNLCLMCLAPFTKLFAYVCFEFCVQGKILHAQWRHIPTASVWTPGGRNTNKNDKLH